MDVNTHMSIRKWTELTHVEKYWAWVNFCWIKEMSNFKREKNNFHKYVIAAPIMRQSDVNWVRFSLENFKSNFDANFMNNKMNSGMCLRDHHGNFIKAKKKQDMLPCLRQRRWSILITSSNQEGFNNVIYELDVK